jgi:hypothetical protein
VELGAGERRNLRLKQLLQAAAHDLRDQGASGGASMSWPSSEAPLWVRVMVCVRFVGSAPNRVTDRPTHCNSRELMEANRQPRLSRGCSS